MMFVAVILATNTIGAVPLLIVYAVKTAADPGLLTEIANDPQNMNMLGMNPNLGFMIMIFPFLIGLLAFIILIKPLNGRTLKLTINGTENFRYGRFFYSGLVWLILSGIYLFAYLHWDPDNFVMQNTTATLAALILISFLLVPFQAAFEEILFRGYLMQGLTVLAKNRWVPLLITSILFGLMHAFNPEVEEFGFLIMMPQYILFGLIFGIITILDDGIEAAMGAHTANNIFLCIMVTHKSSALQTPAVYEQLNVYPWIEFSALFITGIIFIMILKRLFHWDDFSVLAGRVEPEPNSTQSPYTDVFSSVR
jgi:membrane protease YdiL (CAAX protease family)